MNDRELLELAAKATGEYFEPPAKNKIPKHLPVVFIYLGKPWNPLTDDGDALRLAAKLVLNILSSETCIVVEDEKGIECVEYLYGPEDATSATRRAIVRAAAEIGRTMP